MNNWTAIVLIVAIIGLVKILQVRRGQPSAGDPQMQNEQPQMPDPATTRELEDLRERVKVLERIVTDANHHKERQSRAISDEIESLRDR